MSTFFYYPEKANILSDETTDAEALPRKRPVTSSCSFLSVFCILMTLACVIISTSCLLLVLRVTRRSDELENRLLRLEQFARPISEDFVNGFVGKKSPAVPRKDDVGSEREGGGGGGGYYYEKDVEESEFNEENDVIGDQEETSDQSDPSINNDDLPLVGVQSRDATSDRSLVPRIRRHISDGVDQQAEEAENEFGGTRIRRNKMSAKRKNGDPQVNARVRRSHSPTPSRTTFIHLDVPDNPSMVNFKYVEGHAYTFTWWQNRTGSHHSDYTYHKRSGKVQIRGDGLYFVYAQVYYCNEVKMGGFVINAGHSHENATAIARCVLRTEQNVTDSNKLFHTCYTATVAHLTAGISVYVQDYWSGTNINHFKTQPGGNFFGILKLAGL